MDKFLYKTQMVASRIQAAFAKESLHPARFAYPHELTPITSYGFNGSHLLMAEGSFNHLYTVSPTDIQKELAHLMFVGRSRCGKGLAIESNLLNWSFSAIVNDIKRELSYRTAGWRVEGLGGKAFHIDPTGKSKTDKYDPLEGLYKDSDLQSAATTLLYRPQEGQNQIFTDTAITMLCQIFHAAVLEGQRALPFTLKIINEGFIGAATILEIISQKHNAHPNLATVFLDVPIKEADFDSKFLRDCWSTLTRRMRRLLTKESVQCFTGSDFTAIDIMTSPIPLTIFLCWPEKDILALSPLVHLIWTSLMDRMVETYDDLVKRLGEELARKKCKPVLAVLDEIGTTGFPKLPQYAATVAGRNISLLPVFQSFSQIDSHYKEKADELLDNIEVHVVYRPGSYRSAQKLSSWLGDKSGYAHSENKQESGVS